MSTRCNVIVADAQTGERAFLYHHCDGYPEGVGRDLSEMLVGFRKEFEGRRLDTRELVRYIQGKDKAYEPTTGIHGDAEYLYTLKVMPEKVLFYAEDAEGDDVTDMI